MECEIAQKCIKMAVLERIVHESFMSRVGLELTGLPRSLHWGQRGATRDELPGLPNMETEWKAKGKQAEEKETRLPHRATKFDTSTIVLFTRLRSVVLQSLAPELKH